MMSFLLFCLLFINFRNVNSFQLTPQKVCDYIDRDTIAFVNGRNPKLCQSEVWDSNCSLEFKEKLPTGSYRVLVACQPVNCVLVCQKDEVNGDNANLLISTRFKRLIKDQSGHSDLEEDIRRLVLCSGKDKFAKAMRRDDVKVVAKELTPQLFKNPRFINTTLPNPISFLPKP
ncbi:hypothetical protein QVD17_03285 [Tagetes erecta]|uniref:Uncharacterized protein n=1 Tax=Tagetes erecta TaxID=13708 RepID=A0AAD8P9M2_TARER|nr:hypothetical protein QVD17_03285 [Tagetes erecta]